MPSTSPTWHTRPLYSGECQGCGRMFEARNAFGAAAQHHAKTGHTIRLEVTRVFTWDVDGPPAPKESA